MGSRSLLGGGFLVEHHLERSSSVSKELWIDSFQRVVSLSQWTSDSGSVSFSGLVMSGMVLRLGHLESNYTRIFAIYLIITNLSHHSIKITHHSQLLLIIESFFT